nr:hypothetical protein Iba_chr03cCG0630 [Ipomoea batatas]
MAGRWTPSKQSAGFTATCTRSSAIAAAWRTVKEEGNVGYRGGKSPEGEQRRCRSSLRRMSPITRGKSADATPVACIPSDDDHATRVVHLAGERGNRGSYSARRRGRVTERSTPLRRSATDEGQCPALSLPSSAVPLHPLPPRRTEKRRIAEACCWRLHRDTHLWLPELHLAADVGAMLHWNGKTKKMPLQSSTTNQEEMRAKKGKATIEEPTSLKPKEGEAQPPATSQPTSPRGQTQVSPANQPYSPPILSPNNSIFSESVAPSAKDPTPAQSSSLPAAPQRFTKVTDWKSMQGFQYELHLEQERLLEESDALHYELLEEMSMQIDFLRKELVRRGPNTGQ